MSPNAPLTDANRREIDKALYQLNAVQRDVDALRSLGEDVSELEVRIKHLTDTLNGVKQVYWPGM